MLWSTGVSVVLHNIAISDLNPLVIVFKFANIHITIIAVIFGYWAICVTPLFVAFLQANVRVNNHCSMSYKTRPTGDFLKTGKSRKICL